MVRRAFVTGGNRGIGRAIAAGLSEAGCDVVIGIRDMSSADYLKQALGVEVVACDLASAAPLPDVTREVDILINNAGVLYDAPLFSDAARFVETLSVMVEGPYRLMQAALPGMAERSYGRIVNLSSGWGSFAEGLGGPGAYGVAKAGLNALTLAASRQAPAGVKINAMCPGWVRTRMGGASATRSPEEGAETAIWLATLGDDGPNGGFFRDRKPVPW
ncbi:MAG: SDR family NAD(P)-dependent oxidoreductase [Pseudomonadota bacterium]